MKTPTNVNVVNVNIFNNNVVNVNIFNDNVVNESQN